MSSEQRVCPTCGYILQSLEATCPRCQSGAEQPAAASGGATIRCVRCGAPGPPDARFCWYCGAAAGTGAVIPADPWKRVAMGLLMAAGILVCLILGIFLMCFTSVLEHGL